LRWFSFSAFIGLNAEGPASGEEGRRIFAGRIARHVLACCSMSDSDGLESSFGKWCAGEICGFEEICSAMEPRLLVSSARILNNWSSAEEVVQEVFLKLFLNQEKLKGNAEQRNIKAWLFTVAHNLCVNKLKREKDLAWTEEIGEDIEDLDASLQSTHDRDYDIQNVRRALESLSDDARTALALRIDGELEYWEIGAIQNITEQAAKMRVTRAKMALKKVLDKDYARNQ
jgi:RNA polymerase sigma factor (sigma-70 family)